MNNPEHSSGVKEGDILAGKYRIDKVLGAGGMGVVVAAHHIHLDERVAIKFLLPESLSNQEAVMRFAREARAAVKIKSEHVARVSDVGALETGAPYMVMEYLDGGDLSGWVKQRGALPVEQAVEFVLQACEAIAEAHAMGIVHRDLKPANLFVIRRADGVLSVKVLDFGISKVTRLGSSDAEASMTKTSALMGSPLYMSPEQMQSSKNVDSRGDIWALGVILYELTAGDTPFTGETMPELILQIMTGAPSPLRDARPDAPSGFEAVILKCLEKDRTKRYESVGELAVALLPFGPKRSKASVERIAGTLRTSGFSASALVLPPSSDMEAPGPKMATAAAWGATGSPSTSNRKAMGLGAFGMLVVGSIALLVVGRHKPAADPATSQLASGASTSLTAVPQPATKPVEPPPAAPVVEPPASVAPAPIPATAEPTVRAAPRATSTPRPKSALSPATVAAAVKGPTVAAAAPPAPQPAHVAPAAASAAASPRHAAGAYDDRK